MSALTGTKKKVEPPSFPSLAVTLMLSWPRRHTTHTFTMDHLFVPETSPVTYEHAWEVAGATEATVREVGVTMMTMMTMTMTMMRMPIRMVIL